MENVGLTVARLRPSTKFVNQIYNETNPTKTESCRLRHWMLTKQSYQRVVKQQQGTKVDNFFSQPLVDPKSFSFHRMNSVRNKLHCFFSENISWNRCVHIIFILDNYTQCRKCRFDISRFNHRFLLDFLVELVYLHKF